MNTHFQEATMTPNWLSNLWRQDENISNLDPLGADRILSKLPEMNAGKDVNGLTQALQQLLPTASRARSFGFEDACAAMRDLGMLLGSLKRHGVEPALVVPAIEEVLPILGTLTSLPPRDTLLHYTIWNPSGERERSYTGTQDEHHLIRSVQIAMPALELCLYYLWQLMERPLCDGSFLPLCQGIHQRLEGLVEGVVHARRQVSTTYFAQELRLYFDPIVLRGRTYLGPGAVEMPVFVFDHLLWSADCTDQEYNDFKRTYLPYVRPVWRLVYDSYEGQRSLVSRIRNILGKTTPHYEEGYQAASEVMAIGNRLKSFRMPHRKMAEEAYVSQSEGHRSQGSGGYETSILSRVIMLMLLQLKSLEEHKNFVSLT
jgi:monodechloroaminopyrrolnitrin synthase